MLSSQQISEWEAYDAIDPIDSNYRIEYMMAQMTSILVCLLSDTSKKQEGQQEPNFMPNWFEYAKRKIYPIKEIEVTQNEIVADKVLNFFTSINKEEG